MAMPAVKQKKQPSFFKLRAQMLEKGRTNTHLARHAHGAGLSFRLPDARPPPRGRRGMKRAQ